MSEFVMAMAALFLLGWMILLFIRGVAAICYADDAKRAELRSGIRIHGLTEASMEHIGRRASEEGMSPQAWCSMAIVNALQDEHTVLRPAWVEAKIAQAEGRRGRCGMTVTMDDGWFVDISRSTGEWTPTRHPRGEPVVMLVTSQVAAR